jgi:hypothetical protein
MISITKEFFENIEKDYLLMSEQDVASSLNEISLNHHFCLLSDLDKIVLYQLGKLVPCNGTIIEIGSFLGGSASILSSSNPDCNIFSIDLFEKKQPLTVKSKQDLWDGRVKLAFGDIVPRTKERVENLNKSFKNVKFTQGHSPEEFFDWNLSVDMYIEDGDHRLPTVKDNLFFWTKMVKSGGLIVCHDYRPILPLGHENRFIDVEKSVESLLQSNCCQFVCCIAGYVVLRKC